MTTLEKPAFLTATSLTARQINRRVILNIIQKHQPISRADAARHTGLQRSTVSLIVDELIGEGWIVEGAYGRIPRGRRPIYLQMNAEGARLLGLHIDAEGIRGALADLNGQILWTAPLPLPNLSIEAITQALGELKVALTDELRDLPIKGIGIACGNCEANPIEVQHAAEEVFGACAVADTVAVACGEWFLLTSKDAKQANGHLVSIYAGERLELGVIINGEPFRGVRGRAGKVDGESSPNTPDNLVEYVAFAVDAYDPGVILITGPQADKAEAIRSRLESRIEALHVPKDSLKIVSTATGVETDEEHLYMKASVALILNHYLTECDV